MNDNYNEKGPGKVRCFLRYAFDWLDTELMLNAVIIIAIVFLGSIAIFRWQYQNEIKEMEKMLNTISSFMTTATADEYQDIADELHHSLIKRTLTTDDLKYLDYIPNTSENCPFEDTAYSGGPYLVALNTGTLYDLAVYTEEYPLEEKGQYGPYSMDFGYDEVSLTNIFFDFDRDAGTATVDLARENGEISIHRLKGHFCEDCIRELAEILTYKSVLEFVIYDAAADAIYPIVESEVYKTDRYTVSIMRDVESGYNDYQLKVSYVEQ